MVEADGVIFLRPEWLGIGVALALAAWWWRLRPSGGSWNRLMASHLLAFLNDDPRENRRFINRYLLVGAGVALALSGPAIPDDQSQGYRQLDAWVIAIDVSRSMDANDVQPTRLIAARELLMNIADRAGARSVAVVGFAGDAFLLTPFSTQPTQLKKLLPSMNSDTVAIDGSRIERALSLSASLLRDNRVPNGRVLLLTDANDITDQAIDIADRLKRAGQRLDVIVIGTPGGGRVPGSTSPLFVPDVAAAEQLAEAGGGGLTVADRLGRLPDDLLQSLESRWLPENLGLLAVHPVGWSDLSHWMLVALIVPMLLLFRNPAL